MNESLDEHIESLMKFFILSSEKRGISELN